MSKWSFSLIEVIIIAVIVVVIAAISAPAYKEYVTRTKIDTAARKLQNVADEMVAFANKHGYFPTCKEMNLGKDTTADDEIASKKIPHYLPTTNGGWGMRMADTSHNKWKGGPKPCGASARVQVGIDLEDVGLNQSPFTEYEQGFVLECNIWKHNGKIVKVCFGGDVSLGEEAAAAERFLPTGWRPYNQWLNVLYSGQPDSYGVHTQSCE